MTGVQTCARSEEHTSELQSHDNLVCRLLLEKKENTAITGSGAQPHSPHARAPAASARAPAGERVGGSGRGLGRPARPLCVFFKRSGPPEIFPFSPPRRLSD